MGPNGAGKSTLGRALMGDPAYRVAAGSIQLDGEELAPLSADKRSLAGVFLSYQAPVEVPGVALYSFLRGRRRASAPSWRCAAPSSGSTWARSCDALGLDQAYLVRDLNVGFSGGERKQGRDAAAPAAEAQARHPRRDRLGPRRRRPRDRRPRHLEAYRAGGDGSLLIVTHNARLLQRTSPVDRVHVMVRGRLVASGGADLVGRIDREGFSAFERAAGAADGAPVREGGAA